jgi:benzoate membrane transport protein
VTVFEKPAKAPAGLHDALRDLGWPYALNGLAAFVFSCTGPVAIVIAVATAGGLTQNDIASWLFGGFALGGLITIGFSLAYRQPLSFAWTIPGTVLLGSALDHMSLQEAIGAYWVSGALMVALAISGWVRTALRLTPLPIVMAMVAGVFLSFALNVVQAFSDEPWIAASMIAAYVAAANLKSLERAVPPILAALAVGAAVAVFSGAIRDPGPAPALLALPNVTLPAFSLQALLELVLPLTVTVIAVQNAQGFAILQSTGHRAPVNTMTAACGFGSIAFGVVGCVCTCVTGPANAILASYGERERQYSAAIVYGALGVLFGVFAATMTWLALLLPTAYIATLGGLGVLRVLQGAFVTAFSARFSLGALITFVVTISNITILNVGAPFWGLSFGLLASALLERDDFRALREARS